MIAALLVLACVKPQAPELFPEPLAALVEPAPVDFEPAPDECAKAVPFSPTLPVPYLDSDGAPICRAQLVPESQVIELLAAQDDATYWERVAEIQHNYRTTDRAWAEQHAGACWANEQALVAELRVQRIVPPVVFVVGVVVGTSVGVAAARLAP